MDDTNCLPVYKTLHEQKIAITIMLNEYKRISLNLLDLELILFLYARFIAICVYSEYEEITSLRLNNFCSQFIQLENYLLIESI